MLEWKNQDKSESQLEEISCVRGDSSCWRRMLLDGLAAFFCGCRLLLSCLICQGLGILALALSSNYPQFISKARCMVWLGPIYLVFKAFLSANTSYLFHCLIMGGTYLAQKIWGLFQPDSVNKERLASLFRAEKF